MGRPDQDELSELSQIHINTTQSLEILKKLAGQLEQASREVAQSKIQLRQLMDSLRETRDEENSSIQPKTKFPS